jgi:peroxiredoxin Q/BCP
VSTPENSLTVGQEAPGFELESTCGSKVSLAGFRNRQPVVLYFYPKDQTPGCTQEACDFRDAFAQIEKARVALFGISLDPLESHQKFIQKHLLPFPLLSDLDGAVCKAYGVYKLKNMYGKTFWGIERSTFVIDPSSRIVALFHRVKVAGHVQEVLSALPSKPL